MLDHVGLEVLDNFAHHADRQGAEPVGGLVRLLPLEGCHGVGKLVCGARVRRRGKKFEKFLSNFCPPIFQISYDIPAKKIPPPLRSRESLFNFPPRQDVAVCRRRHGRTGPCQHL